MSWWKRKSKPEQAKDCFNSYQNWFASLSPAVGEIDITLKLRIRAFGNELDKQDAWDRDWRSKHPEWGPVSAGTSVSSKVPEIWLDLKMTKEGLVLNPAILGHEMLHTLRLKDLKMANPDLLIMEIY